MSLLEEKVKENLEEIRKRFRLTKGRIFFNKAFLDKELYPVEAIIELESQIEHYVKKCSEHWDRHFREEKEIKELKDKIRQLAAEGARARVEKQEWKDRAIEYLCRIEDSRKPNKEAVL